MSGKPPWQMTLDEWRAQTHRIRHSGNESYYVRPAGDRVLWPGRSHRRIVDSQYVYEVQLARLNGYPIPAAIAAAHQDLEQQFVRDPLGFTWPWPRHLKVQVTA